MTLPNLCRWAQAKGLDVLSTGDCLHASWLSELNSELRVGGDGFLHPTEKLLDQSRQSLPPRLWRNVRFTLGAEVACISPFTERSQIGIHFLVFLPDFAAVSHLRKCLAPHGDLDGISDGQGRPTLRMSPRELLQNVLSAGGELVPAHIWNSYVSLLNGREAYERVDSCFGDLADRILACEAALTSTPAQCRRVSQLDRYRLLANSDAHSPYKLGRECNLFTGDLTKASLFAAIRGEPTTAQFVGTEEYPTTFSRYWLSWCGKCERSWDLPAQSPCPGCGRRIARGARQRIEELADRSKPKAFMPFVERLPLYQIIATLSGRLHALPEDGERALSFLRELGPERAVLNELPQETIARATTAQLARFVLDQRNGKMAFAEVAAQLDLHDPLEPNGQSDLFTDEPAAALMPS